MKFYYSGQNPRQRTFFPDLDKLCTFEEYTVKLLLEVKLYPNSCQSVKKNLAPSYF